MLEIEGKYPAPDWSGVEARLTRIGAVPKGEHAEADHYFNAPDRDFRQTDEALRIRRIGPKNLITYKGPRKPGPTKTRPEIEIPFADGDAFAEDLSRLLGHLGFRFVEVVRKKRRLFDLNRDGFVVHVSLDDVERVGHYVEVEVVAEESREEAARDAVVKLAAELCLSNPETRSYLQLLLEQRK
jgi:adenylate cyclase, class 2